MLSRIISFNANESSLRPDFKLLPHSNREEWQEFRNFIDILKENRQCHWNIQTTR